VRAIVQDKVQHLAFAFNRDDGFISEVEFGVKNILFELRSRRKRDDLERQIVGELETDCFDFGEFWNVVPNLLNLLRL
jgi:hypothetical protein